MKHWILVVFPIYVCTVSNEVRWNSRKVRQGKLFAVLGWKISSSILAPLEISLPLDKFTTAIRAWANHIQWEKTYYHDDFCYNVLVYHSLFSCLVLGHFGVFFCLFCCCCLVLGFFWCVFFILFGFFIIKFHAWQCKKHSHSNYLPSDTPPQWAPLSSSDLHNRVPLHLTSGTRCPKQKPFKIKTSFSADMAKV